MRARITKRFHTHKREGMNKTEARFAVMLNQLKHSGEIVEWKYADVQFQLGEFRCWYRPDFRVIEIDGTITFIETKGGYIWDDSKVKFKAAARQYPEFNWAMYQEKKGKWSTQIGRASCRERV